MILGYDLSQYTRPVDPSILVRLRNRYNLRRAILATYETGWAEACKLVGIPFEAYRYIPNGADWTQLLATDVAWLRAYPVSRYHLDIEDMKDPLPTAITLGALLGEAQGMAPLLSAYTRRDYWVRTLGNPDVSALAQLWDANYTLSPPDANTGFDVGYGGWVRCPVVQYAGDVTLEGITIDLDAWDGEP